jgi:hypothetical protein
MFRWSSGLLADHPLGEVRQLTEAVLGRLSPEFDALYAASGRPSIAPEYILRALLLQVFYSGSLGAIAGRAARLQPSVSLVRGPGHGRCGVEPCGVLQEPQSVADLRCGAAVLCRNEQAGEEIHVRRALHGGRNTDSGLGFAEELSLEGRLDDGAGTKFHGQKRSNKTHASTSDADARLYKKSYGKKWKLSYLGHALVENRNCLIAAAMVTHADGYPERDAALLMLQQKQEAARARITVGADKACDSKDFVGMVRELNVTPHVTKNDKGHASNLDRRTTRQPGYAISLSQLWLIEKSFGRLKQTGQLRQVKLRGLEKVVWLFVFTCAAHNLIRLPKLMAQPREMLRQECA